MRKLLRARLVKENSLIADGIFQISSACSDIIQGGMDGFRNEGCLKKDLICEYGMIYANGVPNDKKPVVCST
jgi:hypothetical protein